MFVSEAPEVREPLDAIEAELAELCGQRNAIAARMVELIGRADRDDLWASAGAKSLEHWVAWKCGVSPSRAGDLVAMAQRAESLPTSFARMAAGVVSEDQLAAIARRAPEGTDEHFADLAEHATVTQLRVALRLAARANEADPPPAADDDAEPASPEPAVERSVRAWFDDDGTWRFGTALPAEEGAYADQALRAHLDALVQEWKRARAAAEEAGIDEVAPPPFPTLADAFLRMCEDGLDAAAAERPHADRTTVIVHLDVESRAASLHLGPALSEAERRFLTCDSRFELLYERNGEPIGVGRTTRTIPRRLRRALEHRDRCCQVPGCSATLGLHAHHIIHWEDGGPTELWNLVLVCPYHHRLHHRGLITIRGPASKLAVHDRRGRRLSAGGLARPPSQPPPDAPPYRPPAGERAQWRWYDPPRARPQSPRAPEPPSDN